MLTDTHDLIAASEASPSTVVVSRKIDAPPWEVWRALTDPGVVARWFGTLEGELAPGASARLDFGDGDFFQVETNCVEPPHRLQYAWRFLGIGPLDTITWFLLSDGEGCVVTVTDDEPGRNADDAAELRKGWLDFTKRLVAFFRRGETVRYAWRHDFDGSIELGVTAREAWNELFTEANLPRWLTLSRGELQAGTSLIVADGESPESLLVGEVSREPGEGLRFKLTAAAWLGPTHCALRLTPHGGGTLLSVSHRGWQKISREKDYAKQQRRRFSEMWVATLRRAQRLAG